MVEFNIGHCPRRVQYWALSKVKFIQGQVRGMTLKFVSVYHNTKCQVIF